MAWGYFLLFVVLHVNKIVYKQIKMLLHAGSWIPISVQSIIAWFLSTLNNKNFFKLMTISDLVMLDISWVHALFDDTDQKWDLIETESDMYKSQMYGHNAGQPVSSLYTNLVVLHLVIDLMLVAILYVYQFTSPFSHLIK